MADCPLKRIHASVGELSRANKFAASIDRPSNDISLAAAPDSNDNRLEAEVHGPYDSAMETAMTIATNIIVCNDESYGACCLSEKLKVFMVCKDFVSKSSSMSSQSLSLSCLRSSGWATIEFVLLNRTFKPGLVGRGRRSKGEEVLVMALALSRNADFGGGFAHAYGAIAGSILNVLWYVIKC